MDYEADVTIITGYNYKLNTLEFNKMNRSKYGEGTDFKLDLGFWFIKIK